MTTPRTSIYHRVTDMIIADLEAGVRPWVRPWSAQHTQGRITLPLRHTGQPYQGVNVLLLWGEACAKGFTSPMWMTYRQADALHAQVRKGERGSLVVYANRITKTDTDDAGTETEREIPIMKGYSVFNVEQIDGLPAHYYAQPASVSEPMVRIEAAETFFAATHATIRHRGDKAFYAPSTDLVQMPVREAFASPEAYCSTLAHELTHWTAHPKRLARVLGKRFGDHAYAAEELIAEIGAAFLCADLGITAEVREDHAAYLAHWLTVLKADHRAIFTAAAQAQQATKYLHQLQETSCSV